MEIMSQFINQDSQHENALENTKNLIIGLHKKKYYLVIVNRS